MEKVIRHITDDLEILYDNSHEEQLSFNKRVKNSYKRKKIQLRKLLKISLDYFYPLKYFLE